MSNANGNANTQTNVNFIEKKYMGYYLQLDENERNRQINLVHVAKGEEKERAEEKAKGVQKVGDKIRVCKVPEFFSHFAINASQDFGITFRHLYTMQLDAIAGVYKDTDRTNYHNLGRKVLIDLPKLIENPEMVINSHGRDSEDDEHTITLACVLNRNVQIQTEKGLENRPLIAFVEPNLTNEKATVILSAYSKEKYEKFLWSNFKANKFLYVKDEKTLKRDCPRISVTNTAAVFFNGSFDINNIKQYCEKVNIKRMEYPEKNKRLSLADVPKEQRTAKVCNAAFRQDKKTIVYFPEKLKTIDKYAEIIETLNKGLIALIPDEYFGASCEKYMKTTYNFKNDPEKLYKDLNKILTDSQRELLKQHIALKDGLKKEYSAALSDKDVKEKFIEWYNEFPNRDKNKTHKMVLDSKENLQQFDTDKNTIDTLVDLVQKSGIPVHADREEFFRIKNLIEESKGDADCMTLRQTVAGLALGVSLMAMPAQLHANSKDKKIITPTEISQAQSMAKMGREYMSEMGMNIVDENNIEQYLDIEKRVQGLMAQFPEKSYEEVRSAVANNLFGQFDREAKKDASHAIRKIKSGGNTYYVFFEDENKTTFITEGAMNHLQEIAGSYTNSLSESPQFQIEEGVTFGYVYKGEIYFNPGLINTNTICHEYTHLWDEHIRITNPELCKKGIELYKKTTLWKEAGKTIWEQVEGDKFYKNRWKDKSQEPDANGISSYDQAIFSECHARAVGKFGAEVLRRIREEDGVDIADAVIDWNKEASDYLAKEFGVEFADDDLARDFFAKPMQDLFSHKKILKELDAEKLEAQLQMENENRNMEHENQQTQKQKTATDYVMDKLSAAGIEVVTDKKEFEKILTAEKKLQLMVVECDEFEKKATEIEHLKNETAKLRLENESKIRNQDFIDFQTAVIGVKKYIKMLPDRSSVHKPKNENPRLKYTDVTFEGEEKFTLIVLNGQLWLSAKGVIIDSQNVLKKDSEYPFYNFETKKIDKDFSPERTKLAEEFLEKFKEVNSQQKGTEILVKTIKTHLDAELKKARSDYKFAIETNAMLKGKQIIDLTQDEKENLIRQLKSLDYENIEGVMVHKSRVLADEPDQYIKELTSAKVLADKKFEVYMIPEKFVFLGRDSKGRILTGSNPDTITNDEFLELKNIVEESNHPEKNVGKRFKEVIDKKQANNVFIRIRVDVNEVDALNAVRNKIEGKENIEDGKVYFYFDKKNRFLATEIKKGELRISPSMSVIPSLADLTESRPVPTDNILTDKEPLSSENNPQKLMQNNITYGFAYNGKIYLDPDLMNSNTPVHEYTHLWDAYTQKTNPELWEKGKDIFSQHQIWKNVINDKNYADIAGDDNLVLSEVHARICGDMAQKILERIAAEDGEIARDKVIDWDREVQEYIAKELSADFPVPELGSETYEYDSAKQKYIQDFFAQPIKDLWNGKQIVQELENENNLIQKMVEEYNFPLPEMYFKFDTVDEDNFIKQIENLDGINPLQMIDVGKTTPVMKALGINENPIKMEQSVVTKALREEVEYTDDKDIKGHSLTLEQIKRIPQALADPIMVFKSRTRNDSYVFFTKQKDSIGRSIIIPVAVNKRYGRIKINKITSIYGREKEIDFVQSNIKQGNLVYVDKKRSLDWERECKVQFLAQVLPSDASKSNILTKDKLVNLISSQNQKSTVQKHTEQIEQNNILNQKERNNMENQALPDSYVVLDTETTGLNADDKILEVAAVKVENGEIVDRFTTLINPGKRISEKSKVFEVNHITNKMLEGQPTLDEVRPELEKFVGDSVIVGHNVGFDKFFISRDFPALSENRTLDTVKLAKAVLPGQENYKLDTLVKSLGIADGETHRALSDSEQTARLLAVISEKYREMDEKPDLSKAWKNSYNAPLSRKQKRQSAKENAQYLTEKACLELTQDEKETLINELLAQKKYKNINGVYVSEDIEINSAKFKQEFPMCELMAKEGYEVYFLSEYYSSGKHADALAGKVFTDVKNVTSENNTKILEQFEKGRLQGDNVIIHVQNNTTPAKEAVRQILRIYTENKEMKNKSEGNVLVLTDKDNTLSIFKINKDGLLKEPSYRHPAFADSATGQILNDTAQDINLSSKSSRNEMFLEKWKQDAKPVAAAISEILKSGEPKDMDGFASLMSEKGYDTRWKPRRKTVSFSEKGAENPQTYKLSSIGKNFSGEFGIDLATPIVEMSLREKAAEKPRYSPGFDLEAWLADLRPVAESVNGVLQNESPTSVDDFREKLNGRGLDIVWNEGKKSPQIFQMNADNAHKYNLSSINKHFGPEFGVEVTKENLEKIFGINMTNQRENTMENTTQTKTQELGTLPPYKSNLITMDVLLNIEVGGTNRRAEKDFKKAMKKIAEDMYEKRGFSADEVDRILLSELPNMDIKDKFGNSIVFERGEDGGLKAMRAVQLPDRTDKQKLPTSQLKFVSEKIEEMASKLIENGMSERIHIADFRRSYNEALPDDFLAAFREYYGTKCSHLEDAANVAEIDGKELFKALEDAGCTMYWSPVTKKLDIVYTDKAEAELGAVPERISFDLHRNLSANHDILRIHEVVKDFSEKVISEKEHEHDSTIIEEKSQNIENATLTEINETNITKDFLTEINATYLEKILEDENSEAREHFVNNIGILRFQDLAKNKSNSFLLKDNPESEILYCMNTLRLMRENNITPVKFPNGEIEFYAADGNVASAETMKQVLEDAGEGFGMLSDEVNKKLEEMVEKNKIAVSEKEISAKEERKLDPSFENRITVDNVDGFFFKELIDGKAFGENGANLRDTVMYQHFAGLADNKDNISPENITRMAREYIASLEENGIYLYRSDTRGLVHVFDERNGIPEGMAVDGKLPDKIDSEKAWNETKLFWNNYQFSDENRKGTYDIMKDAHGDMYRRFYAKQNIAEILQSNGNGYELTDADIARVQNGGFKNLSSLESFREYAEKNGKTALFEKISGVAVPEKTGMDEKQAGISEPEKNEQQDMEVKEGGKEVEIEEKEKSGEVMSPSFGPETDALFSELQKTGELLESEQKALKSASYPKNKVAENWSIFQDTVMEKNDTIKTLMDLPESKIGETLPLIKAGINGEDRLLLQFSQNYDIESGKWYGANMAETEPTKQSQKELKEFQKSNKSGEITRALNEQVVNELGDKYDKDTDILREKLGITHDESEIQEPKIDWPKAIDIKIPEQNTLMNFISGAKTCRTVEDYERLYNAYKEKFTVVENRGDSLVLAGEPCPESFSTPVHPGPLPRKDEHGNSVIGPDGKIPYKYMTFSEKMAYDREQIWKKYHQDKVLFRSADPNELQAYKMLNNLVEADELPSPEHFKELIDENMTKGEEFDVGKAIEEEYTEIEGGNKTSFENVKNNPNTALFAPVHLAQLDNFLETPYRLGTTVPVFSKTDKDGVLNEYRDMSVIGFEGEDLDTEGNPIRDEKGRFTTAKQVVLGKTLPDGQEITVKMSVDEYASMRIENERLRENIKDTTLSEETMEKIKNEYQDKMGLNKDKMRPNTMENYLHNYEAICRTRAENLSEAMTEAKILFDSMPEEERNKLLTVTSRFADENGEQTGLGNFEQKLVDIYNTSRKESPMTDVEMPNESVFSKMKEAGLSDELVEEMKSKTVSENGKPLSENTDIKVGDTISWKTEVTMPFTDEKISESGEYGIVSGNSATNTIILMSADKTSRLEVPYDSIIETAKIIEPKEAELKNAEVEKLEEDVNFSFAENKEKEAEQTVAENTEKEKIEPDSLEKTEKKSEELSASDNGVSDQDIPESKTPHEDKTGEDEKAQTNVPTIMDSVGSNTAADFVRNFEAVCRAASTWPQAKEIKAELYRRLPPEQQEAYKQMTENYEAENKGRKFDNCLRSIWESSVSVAKRKEANAFATDFDAANAIDEYKTPDIIKESNVSIMPGKTNLKVGDTVNHELNVKSYDKSGEKIETYSPPNKITGFSADNNTVQVINEKTGTVFEQNLEVFVGQVKAREKEREKKLEAEKQRIDDYRSL